MPDGNQTQVNILPPSSAPMPQSGQSNMPVAMPFTSPEGYKFYETLVNVNPLYASKLTGLLFNARLDKTTTTGQDSPFAGYTITKIGKAKPNMNLEGFTTVMNQILWQLGEDSSTTIFPASFNLDFYAARATMSIVIMMAANREDWDFRNYTMIYPFGLTLWKSIVAVCSRSVEKPGRQTLMDRIFHPSMWMTPNPAAESSKPRFKWLNF